MIGRSHWDHFFQILWHAESTPSLTAHCYQHCMYFFYVTVLSEPWQCAWLFRGSRRCMYFFYVTVLSEPWQCACLFRGSRRCMYFFYVTVLSEQWQCACLFRGSRRCFLLMLFSTCLLLRSWECQVFPQSFYFFFKHFINLFTSHS